MPPASPAVGGASGFRGRLPDFPWDQLRAYAARARAHPDGIVDLSVGTPVDPTPEVVQQALAAAADSPGYPLTVGPRRHSARPAVDWLARRFGVTGLGRRRGAAGDRLQGADRLAADPPRPRAGRPGRRTPALAYPTYEVGARLAGARASPPTR